MVAISRDGSSIWSFIPTSFKWNGNTNFRFNSFPLISFGTVSFRSTLPVRSDYTKIGPKCLLQPYLCRKNITRYILSITTEKQDFY